MKKMIALLALATAFSISCTKQVTEAPIQVVDESTPTIPDINSPDKMLKNLLVTGKTWYSVIENNVSLSQSNDQLIFKPDNEASSLRLNEKWQFNSQFVDGNLILKMANNEEHLVTGMRFNGGIADVTSITLWLKNVNGDSPEWQLKGGFNPDVESLQSAVNLAGTYAVLLK